MIDAAYYLARLSDRELFRYWELFHKYPTPDRLQRDRLDRLIADPPPAPAPKTEAEPPLKPLEVIVVGATPQMDAYTPPPPVTARAPGRKHARRRKDRGIARHPVNKPGPKPRAVEDLDSGEWWENSHACAAALNIGWTTVKDAIRHRGSARTLGRRLAYTDRRKRSAAA